MKISHIVSLIIVLPLISCDNRQHNADVSVSFSLQSTSESKKGALKITFTNRSEQGVVMFRLITFKETSGPDQQAYWYDMNQPLINDSLVVPYYHISNMQEPSFEHEKKFHLKAKSILEKSDWGKWQIDYLSDPRRGPDLIFIEPKSRKILYYKIKPTTKGTYVFSYIQGKDIESNPSLLRGVLEMDKLIGGKIENFKFVYKGIKVDSLRVDF
jgi:hypothetical protein